DEDRVRHRVRAWELPLLPLLRARRVVPDLPDVPLAHPQIALRVLPDPPCALSLRRRVDQRGRDVLDVNERDVIPGERRVVDVPVAVARVDDPIRPGTPRRRQHAYNAAIRSHVTEVTALSGEPDEAESVEGSRVEAHIRTGQRVAGHLVRLRVDAHDRVEAAIGDPRIAIRSDDHAVRRRAAAELRHLEGAGLRIEVPELAGALRRVPDAAVGRGRGIAWTLTGADRELGHVRHRGGTRWQRGDRGRSGGPRRGDGGGGWRRARGR